jgi:hypothetical protein
MTTEAQRLQNKAVVLSCSSRLVVGFIRAIDVAYELHRQLWIPHWCISISPHKPENFLVRFNYPD